MCRGAGLTTRTKNAISTFWQRAQIPRVIVEKGTEVLSAWMRQPLSSHHFSLSRQESERDSLDSGDAVATPTVAK